MRVPTYQAQVKRSDAGSGQMITAQLNPNTMAAPSLLLADAGNKLAAYGVELYKIQADTQLGIASDMLTSEAQAIADNALDPANNRDPVLAQEQAETEISALFSQYSSGTKMNGTKPLMTNKTAKTQFNAAGYKIMSDIIRQLRKDNAPNIKNTAVINTDRIIQNGVDKMSNPNLSLSDRQNAYDDVYNTTFGAIAAAGNSGYIDSKGMSLRADNAADDIVRGIAANLMEAPGNSPETVAAAVELGKVPDPIFNKVFDQLTEKQKQTVIKDLYDLADARITRAENKKDAEEKELNDQLEDAYLFIINQGATNKAQAITNHEVLMGNNYYTPEKKAHAEAVLGINRKEVPTKSSRKALTTIRTAIAQNTFSAKMLEYHSSELSDPDYESFLKELENERNEGRTNALFILKNFTGYQETKDTTSRLGQAADLLYNQAKMQLEERINKRNQDGISTSYAEYRVVAQDIKTEMQAEVQQTVITSVLADFQSDSAITLFGVVPQDPDRPLGAILDHLANLDQNMLVTGKVLELKTIINNFGLK